MCWARRFFIAPNNLVLVPVKSSAEGTVIFPVNARGLNPGDIGFAQFLFPAAGTANQLCATATLPAQFGALIPIASVTGSTHLVLVMLAGKCCMTAAIARLVHAIFTRKAE